MDTISTVLLSIAFVAMALMIAPRVFVMNRGKTLSNIALWLAILVALGLLYRIIEPTYQGHLAPAQTQEAPADSDLPD